MTKITLVGAGSTSFGLGMLLDLIVHAEELRGSTVTLADTNAESLELMLRVAQGLNRTAGTAIARAISSSATSDATSRRRRCTAWVVGSAAGCLVGAGGAGARREAMSAIRSCRR